MKKYYLLILVIFIHGTSLAQKSNVRIGAYYFGGWTSVSDFHITPKLRDSFPEREPRWGWVSTSPEIMRTQIDLAAGAGLSFFCFDWYYSGAKAFTNEPLNKDFNNYLKSPNKSRLKFNLLVTNHEGFIIGPKDWATVTSIWINLFKDKDYLKVNNKPYLVIYSLNSLIGSFGSVAAVHRALDSLKSAAAANGLGGVTLGLCVSPDQKSLDNAKRCGIDVFTAYNYTTVGFRGKQSNSVDTLLDGNKIIWNRFTKFGRPYIPVSTLNFDPRPWRRPGDKLDRRYYTGYSTKSIYNAIVAVQKWVDDNPQYTVKDKIAMVYAWNEIGEGGYLTPTKTFNPLVGVEQALIYRK